MEKLLVIDGNSIMNRAFYGLSGKNMLTNKEGIPTNAVYGFLNILFKVLSEDKPTHIAVAFDLKAPTFRHKMYDGYKANRKGMPDELAAQMPIIKEVLDAMNIKRVEIEGYEADDILGTLAKKSKERNIETVLFTGDRDSFQLIEEGITVKLPSTKGGRTETEVYNPEKIFEKYGVTPIQLIEVKSLMGDASDNIPGVKGIGEKTALKYIQEFGSLEELYNNISSDIVKGKTKELLIEYKDDAFMSKDLARIDINAPVDLNFDIYKTQEYNTEKLYELFKRLEFANFINKLGLKSETTIEKFEIGKIQIIENNNELLKILEDKKEVAFCTKDDISQIAFSIDDNIFVLKNVNPENLKTIFENENILKIGIDFKELYIKLINKQINPKGFYFDVGLAEYIIDANRGEYSLERVAEERLNVDLKQFLNNTQEQMSLFADVKEDNYEYISATAKVISKLRKVQEEIIEKNNQKELFYDIEMPLIEVLADMQIQGIGIEKSKLVEYSNILNDKMVELSKEIFELVGEEFNINSPKQLGEILFEKLNLKSSKKTQRGYSTDAESLEKLRSEHPVVSKVLEYKQYAKLKSTYADGLNNVINPETKRIHSKFNQMVTATGRLSSTEPNLQNIPVRQEAGRLFRNMFVAKEGYSFIDADYSQIELRILAALSEDDAMINAFNSGDDVHKTTAMQVFGVGKDEVTPLMRARAKAVNFGIVYGQGDFSLGQDLGITKKEAKEYIDKYFEKFPNIKAYLDKLIEDAKEKGYAETIFNRKRYLPEIKSQNFHVRSFNERVAMNMPIQGTAADIIKIAMVKVYEKLKGMNSNLILQVHDELLIEAKDNEIEQVKEIIQKSMEEAVDLKVGLKVELGVGKSWGEAH